MESIYLIQLRLKLKYSAQVEHSEVRIFLIPVLCPVDIGGTRHRPIRRFPRSEFSTILYVQFCDVGFCLQRL